MPKQKVKCSTCGEELYRWPTNPKTKKPIKNFFCDKICKGLWQIRQREKLGYTKEWLESEYITKGKNANQIGKEIGRDGKRVWEWLKMYEIPTRPRGSNYEKNLVMDGSTFRGKKHTLDAREKLSDIAKKDGRVPWGKNNKHPLKNCKPEDHPSYKGGRTPERQAVYSSQEWCEAVKSVWERDNATCQRCGKHHNEAKSRGTFHIHHIISFQNKETQTEVSNLILVCKECHKWIHSKKNINMEFIGDFKNG